MADKYPVEKFRLRVNSNYTFDSICLVCFATIGSVQDEKALIDMQNKHICYESFLADRGAVGEHRFTLIKKRPPEEG